MNATASTSSAKMRDPRVVFSKIHVQNDRYEDWEKDEGSTIVVEDSRRAIGYASCLDLYACACFVHTTSLLPLIFIL